MRKTAASLILAAIGLTGALLLSGCGFQPIYATPEGGSPINSQIHLAQLAAPENVAPYLEDAMNARIVYAAGVEPRYDLYIQANERANRLAVQIDATVTRYNYRLSARYWVIDRETGESLRGVARVVTSYNIVNSQYSTLFAERAAVEKAARQLAEQIERDMLIRFSRPTKERDDIDEDVFDTVLEPTETLPERRRRRDNEAPAIELPDGIAVPVTAGETVVSDEPVNTQDTQDTNQAPNQTPEVPDPVTDDGP